MTTSQFIAAKHAAESRWNRAAGIYLTVCCVLSSAMFTTIFWRAFS